MQFSREMVASRDTVFADHGPQLCSHCITTTEQFWRVSQTERGISDQLTGHTCSGRVAWRGEAWVAVTSIQLMPAERRSETTTARPARSRDKSSLAHTLPATGRPPDRHSGLKAAIAPIHQYAENKCRTFPPGHLPFPVRSLSPDASPRS